MTDKDCSLFNYISRLQHSNKCFVLETNEIKIVCSRYFVKSYHVNKRINHLEEDEDNKWLVFWKLFRIYVCLDWWSNLYLCSVLFEKYSNTLKLWWTIRNSINQLLIVGTNSYGNITSLLQSETISIESGGTAVFFIEKCDTSTERDKILFCVMENI